MQGSKLLEHNRGFLYNMQICARMRTVASIWQKNVNSYYVSI